MLESPDKTYKRGLTKHCCCQSLLSRRLLAQAPRQAVAAERMIRFVSNEPSLVVRINVKVRAAADALAAECQPLGRPT